MPLNQILLNLCTQRLHPTYLVLKKQKGASKQIIILIIVELTLQLKLRERHKSPLLAAPTLHWLKACLGYWKKHFYRLDSLLMQALFILLDWSPQPLLLYGLALDV